VRLPDLAAPTPPPPWRRLLRVGAIGVGAAVLVFFLGRFAELVAFGANDTEARDRVEADVRASLDAMARALRLMALGIADPASVVAAAEGDVTAAQRLFEAAAGALAQARDADYALTAYAVDGRPLAWNGRPSELPRDRLEGEEAWFFARGALGLRLVYVTPVVAGGGERVGTVAAERSLALAASISARVLEAQAHVNFGRYGCWLRGDRAGARAHAQAALEIGAPLGDNFCQREGRLLIGTVLLAEGDVPAAQKAAREAHEISSAAQQAMSLGRAERLLAQVAARREAFEAAHAHLDAAETIFRRTGAEIELGETLLARAEVARAAGDTEAAWRPWLLEAQRLFRRSRALPFLKQTQKLLLPD